MLKLSAAPDGYAAFFVDVVCRSSAMRHEAWAGASPSPCAGVARVQEPSQTQVLPAPGNSRPAQHKASNVISVPPTAGRPNLDDCTAYGSLTLGQVTHHVLALVPLTPLAEGFPHGRPDAPCRHPRSPEAPGRHRGPARWRRNGVNTFSFSVSVSTTPRFVPRHRDAQRTTTSPRRTSHEGHDVPGEVPLGARGVSSRWPE